MTLGKRPAAIELRGIDTHFGAVHANKDVSLTIEPGTIHGLIGENGAGKSTLFHLITGRFPVSSGAVRLAGEDVT
ncbi:ATP-binding cassette domain-containing protein, partial [Klebsiella pneumoniae]|uniref:ATP-binding cassette domain-containing protein n=1 Tax=Klebsiella pneumoniae TaxID=573 RepID=UPI003A8B4AE7